MLAEHRGVGQNYRRASGRQVRGRKSLLRSACNVNDSKLVCLMGAGLQAALIVNRQRLLGLTATQLNVGFVAVIAALAIGAVFAAGGPNQALDEAKQILGVESRPDATSVALWATPSPVLEGPSALQPPCTQFEYIGCQAVVVNTGSAGLNLRDAPSLNGAVRLLILDGMVVVIDGEQVQADGYIWWPLWADIGWVADGDTTTKWLVPAEVPSGCSTVVGMNGCGDPPPAECGAPYLDPRFNCALRVGWPEGSGPFCKVHYYPNARSAGVGITGGDAQFKEMPCLQQPNGDICGGQNCLAQFSERAGWYCPSAYWGGENRQTGTWMKFGDFCLQVIIGEEPEPEPVECSPTWPCGAGDGL
jgi:hypothetical protein